MHEHQCGIPPRPLSGGILLRSSSPDADRGSVPARTNGAFNLVQRSPLFNSFNPLNMSSDPPLSQMLFSHLLSSASLPSGIASLKDGALDLSTGVSPNFMRMSAIPQHCKWIFLHLQYSL